MTRFEEVYPRTPDRDAALVGLGTRLWPIHLTRLYLLAGRSCPEEAKRQGVAFGFCDSEGRQVGKQQATHVGWTVG